MDVVTTVTQTPTISFASHRPRSIVGRKKTQINQIFPLFWNESRFSCASFLFVTGKSWVSALPARLMRILLCVAASRSPWMCQGHTACRAEGRRGAQVSHGESFGSYNLHFKRSPLCLSLLFGTKMGNAEGPHKLK